MSARVSVLMGLYNCASTLEEAIDSIIAQTYTEWKLILCDDGSFDDTYKIAERYRERYPEKIILLKNDRNMGLNHTLNRCLEYADTEYCARMDGDDISHPERLEKQVEFLDSAPEYAIVSSDMELFDDEGIWGTTNAKEYPCSSDFVKGTPFCHAPCMVRREAYTAVCGYTEDKRLLRVEDYELWIKMYRAGFKGANLKEALYSMRDDRNAINRRKFRYRINEAYVKILAVSRLGLPFWNCIYALRPLAVGLLPGFLYEFLHKKRLKKDK